MIRALIIALMLTGTAAAQFPGLGVWNRTVTVAPPFPQDSLYFVLAADSVTGKYHGDTIGIWRNGFVAGNVARLVDAQKPTYRTNIINGKPAIYFDAADDILQSKNNALGYKVGLSVFAVIKFRGTKDRAGITSSNGGYSGSNVFFAGMRVLGGQYNVGVSDGLGSQYQGGAMVDTLAHVHTMLFSSMDSLVYYIDETRYASSTTRGALNLTAELDLGVIDNAGSYALPSDMYLSELIIYGGRVSNAVARQVREYLKSKWGTP